MSEVAGENEGINPGAVTILPRGTCARSGAGLGRPRTTTLRYGRSPEARGPSIGRVPPRPVGPPQSSAGNGGGFVWGHHAFLLVAQCLVFLLGPARHRPLA